MVSIRIKLRIHSGAAQGTLIFQLIADRKVRQITTPYRLYRSEWDGVNERILPMHNLRREYLLHVAATMQKGLERWRKIISTIPTTLSGEEKIELACHRYVHLTEEVGWFVYMQKVINVLHAGGQYKTEKSYQSALRSFYGFRKGVDLPFEDTTAIIIKQYEGYLKGRGVVPNTSSFYLRILRAVYNRAVEEGLTVQNQPFKSCYTGVDKTSKRAVGKEVILLLKQLDVADNRQLGQCRDLFLFSFYARGMAFVDMAHLRKEFLAGGYLCYRRRKTGQLLRIKVVPQMAEIIERYAVQTAESSFLLPIMPNEESPKSYSSLLRNYNRHLKSLSAMLGISTPLSSYISRHSWATIAQSEGVALRVISEGMGHNNENTTRIYLASLDQSVIDKANEVVLSEF